jgi:hypothetical protein
MPRSLQLDRPTVLVCALVAGVLGLLGTAAAQNQGASGAGKPPFASSLEQREEMVRELREIRALMKEQTSLLKQLVDQGNANAKAKR